MMAERRLRGSGFELRRTRRVWKDRREAGEKAEGTVKREADNKRSRRPLCSIIAILMGKAGNNLRRHGRNDSQP